jgi:CPA1 family monovalent cation:H+ antiporter
MRALGLADGGTAERKREAEAERIARQNALDRARRRLEELAATCNLSADVLQQLRTRYDRRLQQLPTAEDEEAAGAEVEVRLDLIAAERELLHKLLREGRLTDEARRRLERELDLEEAYLSMRTETLPDLPL